MELLWEHGSEPLLQGIHGLSFKYEFASLWDYPPFQEFIRPTG